MIELILRDTLPHRTRGAHTTGNHPQQLIRIVGAAPLLMRDDVDLAVHLGLLDQFAVGAHALLAEGRAELVRDERRGVQAGERDELPAVAEGRKALDVRFLLVAGHGRLPVERGREVVCEPKGGAISDARYWRDDLFSLQDR